MGERRWEIGICGTFDVANYGDLLFPLIAEAELTERLGAVTLHRFSYNTRTPPDWPYEVTSITALPRMIQRLDGLLIGGGFLIRFDKEIAPEYGPPSPEIHHPTGYWLTPALIALQHNVPLVWNAPGMHCNEIPAWAQLLLELALAGSRYVSVRDEPTRSALEPLTAAPIAVVPDTAFRLPRLLHLDEPPSAAFTRLAGTSGLDGPYILIQSTLGLEGFVRFLKTHHERLRDFRFLALPIGPVLGERHDIIDVDLPDVVRLPEWPSPLVIAELIARAEAVVGHSYHLFITALAAGVPVFTKQDLSTGKYSALRHFERIFPLPADGEPEVGWFLDRIGRAEPEAAVHDTWAPLAEHWDRIADAFRTSQEPTAPALNRFWQSLPSLLEHAASRISAAEERSNVLRLKLAWAEATLSNVSAQLAKRDAVVVAQEDQLSRLSSAVQRAEGIRWLILGRCHEFRILFEEQLAHYQSEREWRVMLWLRKVRLLFRRGKPAGREVTFPSLAAYMPEQAMEPFMPPDPPESMRSYEHRAGGE